MFNARSLSFRPLLVLLGALLLAAAPAVAQQPPRDYSYTDATGEVLGKVKVAVDAKNYDGAVAIVDGQLAKVPADSYDAALLYQIKTQTLLQKGDFSRVIDPLEKGLALSDAKTPTYYEERATRDLVYFLAQLYLQEAVQTKDKKLAALLFEKADNTMARYLKINPKTTPEAQMIYSQLLYNRAVLDPDHADLAIMKRAMDQVDIGLKLSSHPKDTFYVLKLVCLQQLNRNPEAVEILELLVKQKPDSSTYWQQLAALYLGAGNDLRAILSIERAQSHGLMTSPKDNFNLIGIYFNIGQYEKASELLEKGLHAGSIENEQKNWELLALTYQQLERPFKGIETLKDATKAFPKSGQLEYMIGQAYYALGKPEDALPHLKTAVAKGGLTKPHQVYSFMAYMAYELKKFDEALEAAQKSVDTPEGAKDPQAKNLLKGIQDIMKERQAKKSKM
ncbi:MAG: tetratricopeptide repeat protein [bacterium]|nr:tetratricopeptide repeat protein [bacterium]MDI1336419.1 tetratricopeptide repeat protein [Lacunisphaera sp.]